MATSRAASNWRILSPLATGSFSLVLALVLVVVTTGCQSYSEKFTYIDPKSGHTNQIVNVTYRSFLQFGQAAKLSTETQTSDFIRTVNGEGIIAKPDAASIKAITEGVSAAVIKAINPAAP